MDDKSKNTPKSRSSNYRNNKQHKSQPKGVGNEFNSYGDRWTYSSLSYFGGLTIFDLYSPEQMAMLVRNPMANNKILREISLILYGMNGTYTHAVDFMTAMPTLDKVIVPHGVSAQKKKRNKELMESTLRTIRDKEIIRDSLFRGMIEGAAYYYFETTNRPVSNKKFMSDYDVHSIIEINDMGVNAAVLSLPADYTRIVGTRNSSYVLAFNLDYFNECGENIEKKLRRFPKEIRDAYNQRKNRGMTGGNWVQLDSNKTMVLKIRSKHDEPYGRPLVLAAINDIMYNDYFVQTKHNVLDEINNRIIYQTFPEGKEKGTSALTQAQQEKQHKTVKEAVVSKNNRGGLSFFSVAAGTKIQSLDAQNMDIFDDTYESKLSDRISMDIGIAGGLINGVGSGTYSAQTNNLELLAAQIFQWVDQIQTELNKCINANVIRDRKNWVDVHYLRITMVDKSNMVGYCKDLYLQGRGSLTLWAAACGIEPDVFYALLDQELEDDIENKYPVHQTSYTLSSKDTDNTGGRPTTDNPSDKTIASRSNNGNALPSPSDNK